MTRFILLNILLSLLVSCNEGNGETLSHEVIHEYALLTGDVANTSVLPPVECGLELNGGNESAGVTYFYMENHKDTLVWEEGYIKVPLKVVVE